MVWRSIIATLNKAGEEVDEFVVALESEGDEQASAKSMEKEAKGAMDALESLTKKVSAAVSDFDRIRDVKMYSNLLRDVLKRGTQARGVSQPFSSDLWAQLAPALLDAVERVLAEDQEGRMEAAEDKLQQQARNLLTRFGQQHNSRSAANIMSAVQHEFRRVLNACMDMPYDSLLPRDSKAILQRGDVLLQVACLCHAAVRLRGEHVSLHTFNQEYQYLENFDPTPAKQCFKHLEEVAVSVAEKGVAEYADKPSRYSDYIFTYVYFSPSQRVRDVLKKHHPVVVLDDKPPNDNYLPDDIVEEFMSQARGHPPAYMQRPKYQQERQDWWTGTYSYDVSHAEHVQLLTPTYLEMEAACRMWYRDRAITPLIKRTLDMAISLHNKLPDPKFEPRLLLRAKDARPGVAAAATGTWRDHLVNSNTAKRLVDEQRQDELMARIPAAPRGRRPNAFGEEDVEMEDAEDEEDKPTHDYADFIKQHVLPRVQQQQPSRGGGRRAGSKGSALLRTSEKVSTRHGVRCVYIGKRGGRFYKAKGRMHRLT